ncbi:SagB family peptide dehydrogenase [Streptomyces sp. NBC_01476]|uniref:SagB family peptide dehydrogenase n=1 Tax=Streptomyces sp. NBC_01476 TaxID=2903881 RepID=UPI002E323C07|nr:SagB family peptide dehydrogenase [Streptomyces sp. NBC_01476]
MSVIHDLPPTSFTGAADPPRRLLRLRPDVIVEPDGDDVDLTHPWGRQRVHSLGAGAVARLRQLAEQDADAEALAADPDGNRLLRLLERFPFLVASGLASPDGEPLATAVPIARSATLPAPAPAALPAQTTAVLSRFAYLRRLPDGESGACVVESPLASYRVTLHQPLAGAFVAALTSPRTVAEAAAVVGLPVAEGEALAGLLSGTGFLEPTGDEGADPALWDFHDLLFHSRSRAGRHDYLSGGIFAHADHPQLPAVPGAGPREDGPGIDLPVPDWAEVVAHDPTFTEVLEGRRSVRGYGDDPVTVGQLGELLYRAARVRRVIPGDPDSPTAYDVVDRPYPAGGSTGELEVYLSVAQCEGLEPGVYRYDAAAHRLQPRHWSGAADEAAFRELLTAAWRATNRTVEPQVLITVTSRFGRLSWKYSQIAYALTLKHVGVLYQTLYLVATAMGLGPCGLGSGDTDAAARALGLDWTAESSVGEFLIGSRPAGPALVGRDFADVVAESRGTME